MEEPTHLLLNDELDELQSPDLLTHNLIWNVEDLTKPYLIGPCCFEAELVADHNLYLRYNNWMHGLLTAYETS